MEVYLIRHTTPQIGKGICYGKSDIPLAETFENELKILKSKLPEKFSQVITSPARRCYYLARELKCSSLINNEDIAELDFGKWELKAWSDIDKKEIDTWMDDFVNISCPEGESYRDLFIRSQRFWQEHIEKKKFKSVAIITHGGIIRSLLAFFLKMPMENSFSISIGYGSVTKVSVKNKRIIIEFINR